MRALWAVAGSPGAQCSGNFAVVNDWPDIDMLQNGGGGVSGGDWEQGLVVCNGLQRFAAVG